MIDVSQWRASIGLWVCHQISYSSPHTKDAPTTNNSGSKIDGITVSRRIRDLISFFLVLFLLLLILSGDIELNPGPKTGKDVDDHCSDSQAACKALRVNLIHILDAALDVHHLADKLLSLNIITDDDWKYVNDRDSGQTTLERMRHLLDLIMATVKGNGSVFDQFIDILKDGSQRERDLADRLITSYEGEVILPQSSGDSELQPVPTLELTSSNALQLLVESGFVVKEKWIELISHIGVSLEKRDRLKKMVKIEQDFHFALEEGLQWWITFVVDHSWRDLVSAVENCGDKDVATSLKRKLNMKDEDNTNCSPSELFHDHSADLIGIIAPVLTSVTSILHARELISYETYNNILTKKGESNLMKSSKLINVLKRQLQAHKDPYQYLVDICLVLRNCHQRLKEITNFILQKLGKNPDDISSVTYVLDHPVRRYCNILMEQYKDQPILPTDWPPPVGEDFFGKLVLLERQDRHSNLKEKDQKAFYMLRGKVDIIPKVTQDKQINIQDILKPTNSDQPLRIIVDGHPGIGKTTLCRKLLNMWANGELVHGPYVLVLYCPFRDDEVAKARTIPELLMCTYECNKVRAVNEWLNETHGQGVLIIFDGWDELSAEVRKSSLAMKIIKKKILYQCSLIVTSRTYASFSLNVDSINRHVEVVGFSEKEIKKVVYGTLKKDQAEELIRDLEIREDVYSLCYIPLVCSMTMLVYQEYGKLPKTLTKLYKTFILQTIGRHIQKKTTHDIEPDQIESFDDLPPDIASSMIEMCEFAYLNLKADDNPKMTFSSSYLKQYLSQSIKDEYLGLMTSITFGSKKSFQFLHLTIQEFLAAWWIAKYEKSEDVFVEHFGNDHFRLCLRFVAGLTHLEHESYQQYFNKQLDVQCKRRPFFGVECYRFIENSKHIDEHLLPSDKLDVFLLHLLFESQNTKLCEVLSQAMKNQSLCLHRIDFSLFDILCLSYFLKHSNTTWNYLDLGSLSGQKLQLLTKEQSYANCKSLEITGYYVKTETKLYQIFNENLQECYILDSSWGHDLPDFVAALVQLLKLQHLRILHFPIAYDLKERHRHIDEKSMSKLQQDLTDSTLCELAVNFTNKTSLSHELNCVANTVIKGVTKNKSIQTFSLTFYRGLEEQPLVNIYAITDLLKQNLTLQSLTLTDNADILTSLNIEEVNTPLTTLVISGSDDLMKLPRHFKELRCLILKVPLPGFSSLLLSRSYPNLQHLQLSLNTFETVIELLTALQSNTTLKTLRVKVEVRGSISLKPHRSNAKDILDSIGPLLQNILKLNQAIECLEIRPHTTCKYLTSTFPNIYLPSLVNGLSCNSSLQGLSILFPLSDTENEHITTFFKVISNKNKLTELKLYFTVEKSLESTKNAYKIITQLFYEQGLHLITNLLDKHKTMRLLHIELMYNTNNFQPNWIEVTEHFWRTVFSHPSLQYIRITKTSTLEGTLKSQQKTLIDLHKQLQPPRLLPIIEWNKFKYEFTQLFN